MTAPRAPRALCCTLAALALALPGCTSAEKEKPKPAQPAAAEPSTPPTYQDSISASVTAKVKAVDRAARRITLADSAGREETFRVGPEVQRFNEISPGDTVALRYRANLIAELRPPTAAEAASPIAYVDVEGRAPRSEDPAAVAGEGLRLVTTVEAVDAANMLVTLRGPLGDLVLVKGRNPDNVKRLKRGDTIVITFSHAMAVALEKAR
jgi:hypothetical protein